MLFNYQALENSGVRRTGSIEAITLDVAIDSLQKRGLIITQIDQADKEPWYSNIKIGSGVSNRDVVMLSRQMATLFEAQVSALKVFTLLSAEIENDYLRKVLIRSQKIFKAEAQFLKHLPSTQLFSPIFT